MNLQDSELREWMFLGFKCSTPTTLLIHLITFILLSG